MNQLSLIFILEGNRYHVAHSQNRYLGTVILVD